jgi:hypothetical protein
MRSLALWLVFAAAPVACAEGQAIPDGTGGFSGIGGSGGHSGSGGGSGFNGTGGSGGSMQRPDASTVDGPPMPIDAPNAMQPDAAIDGPPANGPCGSAPVTMLSIPFDQTFTTTGGTDFFHVTGSANDLNTNCLDGDGQGFPDHAFQLTLATATSITVSVDHPETNFPIVLYVRDSDCRTYNGCSGDFFGQQPALSGTNVPAGTYFFIVDGINSSGTFRLTVTSP